MAAKKAAGTYAAYLHGEIMRVVPTYIALGSVVLLFALALSRMHFPTITSEHEGDAGGHGSFRALLHYPQLWFAVAANVLNVGGQICMWSNIIFYMKQYTTVNEKTAANYIIYSLVAMLLGRFHYHAADEACCAEQAAGPVWRDECAADGGCGDAAGDDGRVGDCVGELLPGDHVPDDLRAWD